MKSVVLQLDERKIPASSRWSAFRLLVNSFPVEILRDLRNPSDQVPSPATTDGHATTFDLPLTDAADAATGGRTLDATALSALRRIFLLLDEWDRSQQTARDSSEEYLTVLDTEIP